MKSNFFFLLLLFVVGNNLFGMDGRSEEVNERLRYAISSLSVVGPEQDRVTNIEFLLQESDVVYDQQVLAEIFTYACHEGCDKIVNLLVKLIDQNDELYKDGLVLSCSTCSRGGHIKITKILLDAHEFDLLCTMDGHVMLTLLIKRLLWHRQDTSPVAHIDCLLSYFKTSINDVEWHKWIEAEDNYGRTILHTICDCHYPHKVAVAELFLNYGVNVNIKNSKGQTPLQTAVLCKSACYNRFSSNRGDEDKAILMDTINLFLKYDAEIHTVDSEGNGLLHALLNNNQLQWSLHNLQQLLKKNHINSLKSGVSPMVKNKTGETPLHVFIRSHQPQPSTSDIYTQFSWTPNDIVATLLVYGADVHAKQNDGDTPLHYAAECDFYEVVPMMLFHAQLQGTYKALLKTSSEDGCKAIDLVGYDKLVDTLSGHILTTGLFKKEFMDTELGQQCMHDCAQYRRDAVMQMTGSPSFYKHVNNRAIGYKPKR